VVHAQRLDHRRGALGILRQHDALAIGRSSRLALRVCGFPFLARAVAQRVRIEVARLGLADVEPRRRHDVALIGDGPTLAQ
jgi:hypothetical protein